MARFGCKSSRKSKTQCHLWHILRMPCSYRDPYWKIGQNSAFRCEIAITSPKIVKNIFFRVRSKLLIFSEKMSIIWEKLTYQRKSCIWGGFQKNHQNGPYLAICAQFFCDLTPRCDFLITLRILFFFSQNPGRLKGFCVWKKLYFLDFGHMCPKIDPRSARNRASEGSEGSKSGLGAEKSIFSQTSGKLPGRSIFGHMFQKV